MERVQCWNTHQDVTNMFPTHICIFGVVKKTFVNNICCVNMVFHEHVALKGDMYSMVPNWMHVCAENDFMLVLLRGESWCSDITSNKKSARYLPEVFQERDFWITAYLFYLFRQRVDRRTVKNQLHSLLLFLLRLHRSLFVSWKQAEDQLS